MPKILNYWSILIEKKMNISNLPKMDCMHYLKRNKTCKNNVSVSRLVDKTWSEM